MAAARMHAKALLMMRQTLALPAPPLLERATQGEAIIDGAEVSTRDIADAGGAFLMGAQPGASRFVFDNEKWAHPRTVAPFAMASACVSDAEYAQFVDAGGYARREWWSEAG
jgi:iron(II)-dependent oxidoreductase